MPKQTNTGDSLAEKVAFHASGPLLRKLLAQQKLDEAAGRTGGLGMVAKRLLLQDSPSFTESSSVELSACREQIEHLKLAVDTLRLELRTVGRESSAERLRPLVQELRDDVATAILTALTLSGISPDDAKKVMLSAFPPPKNE